MRAQPAAKVQSQNPNHTDCCRQDSWCQADLPHPLRCAHRPRPHPGQLCPAKCQHTQVTWHGLTSLGMVWGGFPLPRSKGSCASSSEARLSLELPCITLPSMQRSTGRRASTAPWVSRAGHQGCQGTQTPRHAQRLLQMASGRGSHKQSGSQRSPCRTWLFPIPRHLQTPSAWSCFQHRSNRIQ